MRSLIPLADPMAAWLGRWFWQTTVLIVVILAAQWLLGRRMSPAWRYNLWWLLILRLLVPVSWESPVSCFNLFHWYGPRQAASSAIAVPAKPKAAPTPTLPEAIHAAAPPAEPIVTAVPLGENLPVQPISTSAMAKSRWTWATILWLAGLFLYAGYLGLGLCAFCSSLRRARAVTDPELLKLLGECQRVVGVKRPVPLLEIEGSRSPAVFGFLWACLLVPRPILERFSRQELRCIFLHELGHIKRADLLANWLAMILQGFYWFHPLVWLAFYRMRADRELACDALVLAKTNRREHTAYGASLIKLLESLLGPSPRLGVVGLMEDKGQMKRRIKMIANYGNTARWSGVALVTFLAIGATLLTDAQTDEVRLTGLVRDTAGQPIAGARLALGSPDGASPAQRTTSTAQGRFAFLKPSAGGSRLFVQADGFAPTEVPVEDHPRSDPIVLTLVRTSPLFGLVLDQAGHPIAEAAVETEVDRESAAGAWRAFSDSRGMFVWGPGYNAGMSYRISKPGYVPRQHFRFVSNTGMVVIRLSSSSSSITQATNTVPPQAAPPKSVKDARSEFRPLLERLPTPQGAVPQNAKDAVDRVRTGERHLDEITGEIQRFQALHHITSVKELADAAQMRLDRTFEEYQNQQAARKMYEELNKEALAEMLGARGQVATAPGVESDSPRPADEPPKPPGRGAGAGGVDRLAPFKDLRLAELQTRLKLKQSEYERWQGLLKPLHPNMVSLTREIQTLKDQMGIQLDLIEARRLAEIDRLKKIGRVMEQRIEDLKKQVNEMRDVQSQYDNLKNREARIKSDLEEVRKQLEAR